ncbi:multidrug effflux MFS transporter [Novosphingobium lentum]|uniref:multidrug effflux MFS transporter n=1 Tax=Novosphingobium lentum TaxID=145287 RepID=UPI000835670B|nr:multidrug effflux MFS transporter [Novosphingobium lentum]
MTTMNPPAPSARNVGTAEFVAMMAMLMALQALAIDAMLPALGQIAHDLGVSDPNRRQLVVGVFLFCAGIGALVPGSLADRYGRRPVLLCSLGLYVVLSIGCALARDFTALLELRAAQAISSAGLSVLPSAIIRDRFAGDRMARTLSTISVVFMFVPMIAPSLGQLVLLFAGWRWIFVMLAGLASVVGVWTWHRLDETLHPEYRQPIEPKAIFGNMLAAATNRAAFGYVIGGALVFGGMFGYINSSQQLVAEHFGAGTMFPLLFGATALSMALASFLNSRIVERFGARRVSHSALLGFIGLSALQLFLATRPHQTLWQFMPVMGGSMCLIGFVGANFGSISLQPFARIAGAAASVQAFLRMVIGAGLGIIVGQSFDGTARPLALALLGCGIVTLLLVLFSEHGVLFRRLYPPGAARPAA